MQTRSTCRDAPLKFGEMLNSDQSDNEQLQVHDDISSINQPSQLGVRVKASQVRAHEHEGVAVGPDTRHDRYAVGDLGGIPRSRPKMSTQSILPVSLTNRTEPVLERSKIDETLNHSIIATLQSVVSELKNLRKDLNPVQVTTSTAHTLRASVRPKQINQKSTVFRTNTDPDHLSSRDESEQDERSGIVRFSSDSDHSIIQRTGVAPVRYTNTKLPAFTGKESWTVYYNRFQEVADRRGWNDEQCLDELIPKLQGNAGDFVFNQLSSHVRRNYRSLVNELNSRFRVIENPRTFQMQFSHRDQKTGEAVESYVAELKRLYDKGHTRRDTRTRNEDLLRRFMDGLLNEKASFHVEYIKGPTNIDEAAYEVIHFLETSRSTHRMGSEHRHKHSTRMVRPADDSDSESESDVAEKPVHSVRKLPDQKQTPKEQKPERGQSEGEHIDTMDHRMKCLEKIVQELKAEKQGVSVANHNERNLQNTGHRTAVPSQQIRPETRICYNCNTAGHLSRNCLEPHRNRTPGNNYPNTWPNRPAHVISGPQQQSYNQATSRPGFQLQQSVIQPHLN